MKFIFYQYEFIYSKLVCILLNAWDGNREWTIDFPENEEISGLAVTSEWVAAATSMRFLRLYTLSGGQREIVSIPGLIVAVNGSRNRLVVVHHCGTRMYLFLSLKISSFFIFHSIVS